MELGGAAIEGAGAAAAAGGPLGRMSEALDVFFCRVEAVGREMEAREGFLRSCSVEGVARNCDWLAD